MRLAGIKKRRFGGKTYYIREKSQDRHNSAIWGKTPLKIEGFVRGVHIQEAHYIFN